MINDGSLVADIRTLGICRPDNYHAVIGDPTPRAIRWANRSDRFGNKQWSKWHFTEGNGAFTACGRPVVLFQEDGSPQEDELPKIQCNICRIRIDQVKSRS
jgi:hypothetical protein